MQQQAFQVEHRLSELQGQIDRLSLALNQWRQTQDHLQPMEQRLSQLTERCAEILNRWTATDERHTRAVNQLESRLSEWNDFEARLHQDSHRRIRELEGTIEQEWQALREIHEEPARQLRDQATALGETCVAAANLALRGFERAEARFAALEADLQGRMAELSQSLESAVAELRATAQHRAAPLRAGTTPFPLESVMRIHDDLRDTPGGNGGALPAGALPDGGSGSLPQKAIPQLPEASVAFAERMESLERALTTGKQEARETADRAEQMRRASRVALVVLVLALVAGAALWFQFQRQLQATVNESAVRAAAAERRAADATALANQQITSTREDAERQIAEARRTAEEAQLISNILAAPDLVRYTVTGGEAAPRAYGQLLWSRSRGMVFSASRLPEARGGIYQLWLTTNGAPVSGGLLEPDAAGRVSLASGEPPNVPRPVTGAAVTLEPAGGRTAPSGAPILARAR